MELTLVNDIGCTIHSDKIASFICMDTSCMKSPKGCIICIKNDHHSCADKCILSSSEFSSKVKIKKTDNSELDEFKKTILTILEDKKDDILSNYKKFSEKTLNIAVSDQIDVTCLNNLEKLKGLKEYCNFRVTDDDIIEISPQFNPTGPSVDEDLEQFSNDLDSVLSRFSQKLSKITFYNSGSLDVNEFIIHEKIGRII